ncbi:C5a anaphylatoxin chemotactic receptor 1-like [Haliotis asinina]|uniref:C5a anaphylatoxin chemotactic receptor 1-like n=1 Tax=Haliotis asinina TaxID=109174 RepID=UPI0035326042
MDDEYFNSSNYSYDYDYESPIPYATPIVLNSVLLYIGVCANIWMIRSLYKSWKTGSRMHFYLLAICVADLLGLCIRCGLNIGLQATVVWRGGYYGCKLFAGFQLFGATMSHLILAGFNIDNLFTVICSRSIKALRIVFLLLSFVVAFIVSGVKFYFYHLVDAWYNGENMYYCTMDLGSRYDPGRLVHVAAYFLLPLLMMILFGVPSIFVWCCQKGTLSYGKTTRDDDSSTDLQFIGRDIGTVLAYDLVFFLCCAPGAGYDWLYRYYAITAHFVMLSLETANPCLNPFIYAIFNCIGRRNERTSPEL